MDYTVHGLLQARILEWAAFPFSRGSSQPRDQTQISCIIGGLFLSAEPPGKPKNTRVGSLSLLQWIFLTQESNWGLLNIVEKKTKQSYLTELMVYLCLSTALMRCPRQISVCFQQPYACVSKLCTHVVEHYFWWYRLCDSLAMSIGLLSLSQRLMSFWAPSRARVTI